MAHDNADSRERVIAHDRSQELAERFAHELATPNAAAAAASDVCSGGSAGGYPCSNVDLMSFMPLADIGGGEGNDIWGWTDSQTGSEYALMGRTSGTAFVDITDPANPVYLGNLPTATVNSNWRDVKVYADHAYIVSEASGHGMQVFDLTRLRNVVSPPATFAADTVYGGFGSAHNIVINEDSGFAYGVGTNTCAGGLHMVNIQNPIAPANAGCYSGDGYTHDAQCVIYNGPDSAHVGKEICVASNEDTVTIVDVTNKAAPVQISRTRYKGSAYTHQGWLTEDHAYFLLDDELDEQRRGVGTTTVVWNMSNLDRPRVAGTNVAARASIDHNQYIKGNFTYQANYRSGLRILELTDLASGNLTEAGYFDIYPASDSANFNGAWSVYPYFDSGVVIVSGIEQGLFVLKPTVGLPPDPVAAHVGDLDGVATAGARGKWTAAVTITVHDGSEISAAGVTVGGSWSNGGTDSCVTDAAGTCSVEKAGRKNHSSIAFTIDTLSGPGVSYDFGLNHDPDGDSNGTTITVSAP